MISYSWPPGRNVGIYRSFKFAKYLDNFGWEPTVVAPETGKKIGSFDRIDGIRTLRTGYKDALKIFKSKIKKTKSQTPPFFLKKIARELLTIPDEARGWYKPALEKISDLLRREHFDAIYSTSPPETSHFIAKAVKKRFGVPWIADLRDPWAGNHYFQAGLLKNSVSKILEKKILNKADILVTVSDPWSDTLKRLYPGMKNRVFTITHSFDRNDRLNKDVKADKGKFIISYTGKIHRDFQDPGPFFRALGLILDKGVFDRNLIRVRFYTFGYYRPDLEAMIKRHNLDGIVRLYGQVSHEESILRQLESTALLFIDWRTRKPLYSKGVCPHKIFEYMGAEKPILVVSAAGGAACRILKTSGAARLAANERELEEILEEWFKEFREKGGIDCKVKKNVLEKYSAEFTTGQLAGLLDKISG